MSLAQNQLLRNLLQRANALTPKQKGCCCFLISLGLCLPAFAKETVYLKTGFSLEAESHIVGNGALIFRVGTGTVEFSLLDISRIEQSAENVPPATNVTSTAHPDLTGINPLQILHSAAVDFGLDENFMRSVAKIESGLNARALSPKGALGLMQLMPATATYLGVDASEPRENAHGGAIYLRSLLMRYGGNAALALAAYNAGPAAVEKYGGVPPYQETRRYILRVIQEYRRMQSRSVSMPGPVSNGYGQNSK